MKHSKIEYGVALDAFLFNAPDPGLTVRQLSDLLHSSNQTVVWNHVHALHAKWLIYISEISVNRAHTYAWQPRGQRLPDATRALVVKPPAGKHELKRQQQERRGVAELGACWWSP